MINKEYEKGMELLEAQVEIEYLKESNSIYKNNIIIQNKQIVEMQELLDEQNHIISDVIKDITNIIKFAVEEPSLHEVIKKKFPNYLKV